MVAKRINKEIFLRIWFISKYGRDEHRNGALSRLALLRDSYRNDRRFPSVYPTLDTVETECWTWWHQVDEEVNQALAISA